MPEKANRDKAELSALTSIIRSVQAPAPIPRSIMDALREAVELVDEGWGRSEGAEIDASVLDERNRLAAIAGMEPASPKTWR